MELRAKKPLYLQIYADLREQINDDHYKIDEFLPSERELGEFYQVERATVRRALELLVNDGLLVKIPGSGSKVLSVKKEYDDKGATESNNIAFILPGDSPDKITEAFTSNVFYHFEQECKKLNYHLFYTNLTSEERLPVSLLQNDLKGIVWVSKIPHSLISQAKELNIPALLISNSQPDCLSVLCDNNSGICQAMEHLVSLGHSKIAFLGGTPSYFNAMERRDGYLRALAYAKLPYDKKLMIAGDWSFNSGYDCTINLIKQHVAFTAICAANDTMALGVIKALAACGISVPGDVSVIGFDNIEQCTYSTPSLSTVGIDAGLFAGQMMRSLSEQIRTRADAPPVKILIPTQLFARESTASPKNR